MSLDQKIKEKCADAIIDYTNSSSNRSLESLIDSLDLAMNPGSTSPNGSREVRTKIADLIKDYTSGCGKLGLEDTIEEVYKIVSFFTPMSKSLSTQLQHPGGGLLGSLNLGQRSLAKNYVGSRFSYDEEQALKLKFITTEKELYNILSTVIHDGCIYKVEVKQNAGAGLGDTFYAEFTDDSQTITLFSYLCNAPSAGLRPEEIVLGVLKSFYDNYATNYGILKYNHALGKIELI